MRRRGIFIAILGVFLCARAAQGFLTPPKRILWTPGNSLWPAIAADSHNHIHLVWSDGTPGNYEIFYKRSTDGGAKWTTSDRLTGTSGDSVLPAVATDSSGNIHVVWADGTPENSELYYTKSTDGGATWGDIGKKRLTYMFGSSSGPALAVDPGDTLHLVWPNSATGSIEIYYMKSTDAGATWTPKQRLTYNSGKSMWPAITADSAGVLHVVWQDDKAGNPEIYYMRSSDGGVTWPLVKRLTWTAGESVRPALAVLSGINLHVVFSENMPGSYEICYKRSGDGGSTWAPMKRLTWTAGDSGWPALAVAPANKVYLAWADDTPGNEDIYGRMSTNGGTTWTPTTRVTYNSGRSLFPAMVVDLSGFFHLVWQDDTPGNFELYYLKGK